LLARRLAFELHERVGQSRVTGVGLLADGRFAIVLRRRRETSLLAVDLFGSPPLVTLEDGELGLLPEPGFVRTAATALAGTILTDIRARRGDRVLRLTFQSRSRFGVSDELELYLELVPRFGNLVLVKRGTVVAAAKEFSPAENARRSVLAGQPYEPPPLPGDAPAPPKAMAANDLDREQIAALIESDVPLHEQLYVYRDDGRIVQAHVVPLSGLENAGCSRASSLLDVFAEFRRERIGRGERERDARRRAAMQKRLGQRERKIAGELAAIADRRESARARDSLRSEGEAIFARLHELPPEQRVDAKAEAQSLFSRYKKLGKALPHLDRRERELHAETATLEALRWETERVAPEDLEELEAVVAPGRATGSRTPARKRKRAPLEVRTPSGSRIVVGRSPAENAHLTFSIARPNDLWFHARGIPGAHVILARDDRSAPPREDIETAAALAAAHSKARASAKVAVDYALRKHVRKQRDALPGLVWYTNANTVLASPQSAPALARAEDAGSAKAQPSRKEVAT